MTDHTPSPSRQTERQFFNEAFRDSLPALFGFAAWGLVVGVAMIKSQLSIPQALAMSFLVYAGSAQLAALPLMMAHTPVWVIFATALVVNLRFVIFSALLAPHFRHLSWRSRLVYGFYSGDMTVALFMQRFPDGSPDTGKLSYLRGLLLPSWVAWQAGTLIGIFAGSQVPMEWGLSFAGTLAIICVAVPLVAGRAAQIGCAVAAVIALAAHSLPYKLGLLLAMLGGMLVALAAEEYWQGKGKHE
ncbi:AzlC family ABC transporter permease [Massilia sp. W12]|uniref:AzlC family ABC transporter permease n=1 Tax=Massilia sp. W12 TaxID=3126507 RepID=UPI0030D1DC10